MRYQMERLHVSISEAMKRRLEEYADSRNLTQGDVVDDALKNFFERLDRKNSAPDLVLDRLNTLTMSVMQLNMAVGRMNDTLERMGDESL